MSIVEMKVPVIGESITEVTLAQWLVEDGSIVELDQPICEFESDKATLEFPAEAAGKITFVASEDDDLEIGALVAKIDTSVSAGSGSSDSKPAAPAETKEEDPAPAAASSEKTYATGHPSPAAAKIIEENQLNKENISGTGRDGRITKGDAQQAAASAGSNKTTSGEANAKTTAPAPVAAKPKQEPPAGTSEGYMDRDFSRNERTEKMSRMRRTIARRLVSAKNNTAMLTTFNEADMSAIFKLRKTYQERFVEKNGIKLGFMSIFAKACAQALLEFPDVNARIEENNIVYHDYVDISIAISTPNGLVVPPVRNVESMSFSGIEKEIKNLASKARNNELSLDEMTGGTFTITNGGIFGSMLSTPILNEPQSAILGMHNIIQRPVAVDGQVEIRPMMYLALSYDHRIIDGSTSVTFLVRVKELLEDPVALIMGV